MLSSNPTYWDWVLLRNLRSCGKKYLYSSCSHCAECSMSCEREEAPLLLACSWLWLVMSVYSQGTGESLRRVWEHSATSEERRRLPQQRHVIPVLGKQTCRVSPVAGIARGVVWYQDKEEPSWTEWVFIPGAHTL